jgi:TonB-dependent SusC/RagA subfamily outer membrane receptor
MRTIFTLSVILLVFSFSTFGQTRLLKGVVTTFDSIPLVNASIKIQSSRTVVFTDSFGNFNLQCKPNDKLKVSAKGFYTQHVKITEDKKMAFINLKLMNTEKAKEVAVGYGHVKDKDKLFAIAALTQDEMDFSMYQDIYDLIKGRFSEVTFDGDDILIRGTKSINSSNAALIIMDGMIIESSMLGSIVPANIKSINILKDASTSIYGSRGANGAVIIETKKGGD